MLLNHQMSGTDGARKLALGSEIERQKTEPPLGFNIHGLYQSSTVWTNPWCWLPTHNPLILIAYKHQTHLSFCLLISLAERIQKKKKLKFSVKTSLIAVWSSEFFDAVVVAREYMPVLQIYLKFWGVLGSTLEQFSWVWGSNCLSGFVESGIDFCV